MSAETDAMEIPFLDLTTRITLSCVPDAATGGEGVPWPGDLPGAEGVPVPGHPPAPGVVPMPSYGPGRPPPGIPHAEGDMPAPEAVPAPPAPGAGSAGATPVGEVPLSRVETCSAGRHAERVSEAFRNSPATGYEAMRDKLMSLGYPASRIHRMPDLAGAPRARLDLRVMGGRVALEVTGTATGVIVEAFGAPETEDVKVTDVRRRPDPAAPVS